MAVRTEARGGAKPLKDLLAALRREWRRGAAQRGGLALPEALAACLGPEQAAALGFGGLSRGTLTLTVDSAALLAELEGFQRTALLSAIQGTPEGARVRTLRFVCTGTGGGNR